jgi:hypothetical protein
MAADQVHSQTAHKLITQAEVGRKKKEEEEEERRRRREISAGDQMGAKSTLVIRQMLLGLRHPRCMVSCGPTVLVRWRICKPAGAYGNTSLLCDTSIHGSD